MIVIIIRMVPVLKNLPASLCQKQWSKNIVSEKKFSLFLILRVFKEKIKKNFLIFFDFFSAGFKKLYFLKNFFVKIKIYGFMTATLCIFKTLRDYIFLFYKNLIKFCGLCIFSLSQLWSRLWQNKRTGTNSWVHVREILPKNIKSISVSSPHLAWLRLIIKNLNFPKNFFLKFKKPKQECVNEKTKLSKNYWSRIKKGLKMSK